MKFEDYVIEMTNIRPSRSGLPMVIWVQPDTGRSKHGPRIIVQSKHGNKVDVLNLVSVTISKNPEIKAGLLSNDDFKIVKNFILLNYDNLIKLWKDKISPANFVNIMKRM